MQWRFIISNLDVFAPLTLLLIVLVTHRSKKQFWKPQDRMLVLFLGTQGLLNGLAWYIGVVMKNNIWIYHLNCLLTQLIFTNYFYQLFSEPKRRRFVVLTTVLFVLFFVCNVLYIQPLTTFNSYTWALGAFFIVAYGFMCFYKWMQALPATNILALKEFWGAAGVLFYFGSSFFIFVSYEYLTRVMPSNVGTLWWLHNIFLAISCLIFAKAILAKEWIQESSSLPAQPSLPFS